MDRIIFFVAVDSDNGQTARRVVRRCLDQLRHFLVAVAAPGGEDV
jgi:hypothetical protein